MKAEFYLFFLAWTRLDQSRPHNSQKSDLRVVNSATFLFFFFLTGREFTCIMSSVHPSVVVAHSVQVVQVVVGKDQIGGLLLSA